jgi:threonyl-tRNA synthetase
MVQDALGREWQLGTIQVDYNLPERFELEYTGSDNEKHRPVMIAPSTIWINGTLYCRFAGTLCRRLSALVSYRTICYAAN